MSDLPVLAPLSNAETEPFWTGAAAGRLVLPRCDACGHHIWYPRSWCPVCGSDAVTWTELSGRGSIYAVTVIRRAMGPWADAAPFAAAYVELAEGPRILTNVVTDAPERLRVGDAVRAVFVPVVVGEPDGAPPRAIVRFEVG
ncbi:MAG: Zn-ribbon domain-containing OB-fold protein [Microthrixaceae bacterium]